jgi:hypothetical protein
LVNGDPTKNINLLADPEENFLLIIKNESKALSRKPQETVEIRKSDFAAGWLTCH